MLKKQRVLTVKSLIYCLAMYGYQRFKPKCKTWSSAFIGFNNGSLICFLFRKNGVDIRYYEKYEGGLSVDAKGFLSLQRGAVYRNHYNESTDHVNLKIRYVAYYFMRGISVGFMSEESGQSYLLNLKYPEIRKLSKERFEERREEMRSRSDERFISEAMSGFGVYWGMD